MGFTSEEKELLYILNSVASGISIVGCAFIIIVYFKYKQLQIFHFRLVLYLSIIDLLHSVAFLLPTYSGDNNDAVCKLQGTSLTFLTLSSVLWTAMIAFTLYRGVVKQRAPEDYEYWFLGIALSVPAAATGLPFITHSYGPAEGWCWIEGDSVGNIWRLSLFYGPLWIVIVFNVWAYFRVIRSINSQFVNIEEEYRAKKQIVNRLRAYPIILVICFTPVTINRFYEFLSPDNPNYTLTTVSGILTCLNGFANALVYGFTKTVREAIRENWSKETPRRTSSTFDFMLMSQYE